MRLIAHLTLPPFELSTSVVGRKHYAKFRNGSITLGFSSDTPLVLHKRKDIIC